MKNIRYLALKKILRKSRKKSQNRTAASGKYTTRDRNYNINFKKFRSLDSQKLIL